MLRGVLRLAIRVVAGAKGGLAALRLALQRWRSLVETRYVVAEDAERLLRMLLGCPVAASPENGGARRRGWKLPPS
jgi:hypothetical protein